MAEGSAEVERIAASLKPITNQNMASDLTTAIALARAAIAGAIANVEINLESIQPDSAGIEEFVAKARSRVRGLRAGAASLSSS